MKQMLIDANQNDEVRVAIVDKNNLIDYVKRTEALAHGSSLISWDQETMMPKGSVSQRADCLAAIESEIHNRRSNLKIADLLSKIDIDKLSKEEKKETEVKKEEEPKK